MKSLPVRAIASERERKVRLLDDLTDRIGVVVLVVVVVMEGMMYILREKAIMGMELWVRSGE